MQTWQLQQAKSRLSELIRLATSKGPQAISVRGVQEVIIMSKKDYDKLTRKKLSFVKFMQQSPLMGLDIKFERDKSSTMRNINL